MDRASDGKTKKGGPFRSGKEKLRRRHVQSLLINTDRQEKANGILARRQAENKAIAKLADVKLVGKGRGKAWGVAKDHVWAKTRDAKGHFTTVKIAI